MVSRAILQLPTLRVKCIRLHRWTVPMEPQALYIYHYKERAGETDHHQKDCANAEFLRLGEEENILEAVFDSIGIKLRLVNSPILQP